jgi:hypothetical protein
MQALVPPRSTSTKAGAANYDEIGDEQNPKGVVADDRDVGEDPHDRNNEQREGYHRPIPETDLEIVLVEKLPDEEGDHQNPKSVIANHRNFDKDSYDRGNSDHKRDHASEAHSHPPTVIRLPRLPFLHQPYGSVEADPDRFTA